MPKTATSSAHNAEEENEKEVLLITREFDELELIHVAMLGVAVPFDAPEEFKARVLAAAGSYLWGNKSIDYQLKQYREQYSTSRPNLEERVLFRALMSAKRHVSELAHQVSKFPKQTVNSGRFAAEACLVRLPASFTSAILLLRQGYAFEAAAICRLILEQLAWVYAIHECEDDKYMHMEPNRCITDLKNLMPSAGRFYGQLSEMAHLHPKRTFDYIDVENNQASIRLKIPDLRWSGVFDLLTLADWYRIVGAYTLFEYLRKDDSILRTSDGQLISNPARVYFQEIVAYARAAKTAGVTIDIEALPHTKSQQ